MIKRTIRDLLSNDINEVLIEGKEGYEIARIIGYIDFQNKSLLNWLIDQL